MSLLRPARALARFPQRLVPAPSPSPLFVRASSSSSTSNSSSSTSASASASAPAIPAAVADTFAALADKFKAATEFLNSAAYDGVEEKGLRMLVFGKPGSGKGTLSSRLVKDYDISFVSTGDVLRKEIAAKSEVGRKAEAVVASGGLVSDELMLEIVKAELDRLKNKSWIIDGFPRTLHQGELLDAVLNEENRPLNMIVHLNVPDSVIMARISARWVHLPSGRVYNTTYSAPKVPGKDDITGEPLSKRPDDTPETFSKRLQAYYESTAPLLEFFSKTYPESLYSLSGSSSDEVLIAAGLKAPPTASSSSQPSSTAPDQNASSLSTSTSNATVTLTPSSPSSSSASATPTSTQNTALEQLWPQLQALIEPFNLRRRPVEGREAVDESKVREEADDLRDSREVDVPKQGRRVVSE
ncbi:hypothetical protein IAT38_006357 [Cryptococcus sp. DSM 104549]